MSKKDSHKDVQGPNASEILKEGYVKESINYGVTPDTLNYKRLFGYFFGGIILVSVMVYGSKTMFNYFSFKASQEAAINAVFYDIEELRAKDKEILTTFGVVDEDKNLYRVPVDSAITLILNDYK